MENILENIIMREVKDSLTNHIKTVLFNRGDYFKGSYYINEFIIWKYSVWAGAFYPVIIGKIIKDKETPKIQFRTKMNSFGRLIQWTIMIGLSYALIYNHIISFSLDTAHLLSSLGGLILILLFMMPMRMAYWYARKDAINELKKLINKNAC